MLVAGSLTVLLLFAAFHAAYVAQNALTPEAFEAFRPALFTSTWRLLLVGVMYIGVVTLASVFISHRITGPTGRLETEILKIAEGGEVSSPLHVREGDEFEGLVGAINKLVVKVRGVKK